MSILLENGSDLLVEDGGSALLESGNLFSQPASVNTSATVKANVNKFVNVAIAHSTTVTMTKALGIVRTMNSNASVQLVRRANLNVAIVRTSTIAIQRGTSKTVSLNTSGTVTRLVIRPVAVSISGTTYTISIGTVIFAAPIDFDDAVLGKIRLRWTVGPCLS